MLFDTDILIWCLRGNAKAAKTIDTAEERAISVVTYMELLQGARDKRELKSIRNFLADSGFSIVPLTENIGHRASIYMEEYCLKVEMGIADALIAATAAENRLTLATGNEKHYRPINDISLQGFKP
jgi:predicted nucleic acid-binding protein